MLGPELHKDICKKKKKVIFITETILQTVLSK